MSGPDSEAKPPGQPGYSAFISYATKADQQPADEIVKHLEQLGLKCWIAPRDVRHGRSYGEEIIRGIERSGCLILVLSQEANRSKFVRKEVERAVSKDKSIFTIRIEDVQPSKKLELFISDTHWVDAWDGDFAAHAVHLAEMLHEEAEEEEAPPQPKIVAPAHTLDPPPIEPRAEPKPKPPPIAPAKPKPAPLKQETRAERKPPQDAAPRATSLGAKWWLFAVRGALALSTGAALIADGQYSVTDESLATTGSLLAAYLIADGLLAVATGLKWRNQPWRFAFIAEALPAFLGAASILTAGYEPTRVALFFVMVGAVRLLAARGLDAREGRWALLASAVSLLGFAFVFVTAAMGAGYIVWGSTYLTTWGLLLFAAGAGLLFVASQLGMRRREQQSADGLAQMRSRTAALARIAPAFTAAGIALIAAGLPSLLWWLLPASPMWNVFGMPLFPMAAIAVGILLYGAFGLAAGVRLRRTSRLGWPLILYGAASVLLGASSFVDLIKDPATTLGFPEALFIADPLDRFFGAWGLWALVTGGLLLALAAAIDDAKFRLAGASVALLAIGFFLILAALDYAVQENMFLFWMGTVAIVAGLVHMLFASTLRTYESKPHVSAHA